MSRVHLVVGAGTLAAFLISGSYMRLHEPPIRTLDPGLHVMFTSRHIYILAAALIHLVLAAYVRPGPSPWAKGIQWLGSALLVLAAGLLITAFVHEPIGGRYATGFSRFGLFGLFGGSLLHFAVGLRSAA